jgi:hypothetical protein
MNNSRGSVAAVIALGLFAADVVMGVILLLTRTI